MKASASTVAVTLVAATMVLAGNGTAQAAPTRYEAENSPAICTGTIDSNHAGFSGSGFCNGNNATSGFAQFTVNASSAGTATLGFRFANGTTTVRPANLVVNGSTVQNVSFEGTGAWTSWVTKTLSVAVNSGSNTIRLNPTTANGLANIDFLDFEVGGTTPQPPGGLIGWGTQGGGTTGGAGGQTVTVTSLSALTTAAASTSPMIIRVQGRFTCNADVRVMSNKSILGVGSGSGLNGCGLNLRDVSNIIVRNMNIGFVQAGSGNGDAIHIDHATRIWIDHNDLSSDTTHGTDFYDGLLDITHAADFITVSWNRLHDHIKCSLVGHSDSNASEDRGHLRVTYHHNWFSGCASRNPRVRFGNPVHVFNNYYNNIQDYGAASTIEGGVLVEGNYYENVPDPFHVGEGSSPPGTLVARNNTFVNSGSGGTSGSVGSIPYQYSLESSGNVRASVMASAGTGRISV
ncbi:MAG TPA: carbohydrate-binding protein [Candidatus Limnocylindrales bacterium]